MCAHGGVCGREHGQAVLQSGPVMVVLIALEMMFILEAGSTL